MLTLQFFPGCRPWCTSVTLCALPVTPEQIKLFTQTYKAWENKIKSLCIFFFFGNVSALQEDFAISARAPVRLLNRCALIFRLNSYSSELSRLISLPQRYLRRPSG